MVYDNEDIREKDNKIYYVDNLSKMKELVKLLEEKRDSINIHICLEIREFLEFYRKLREKGYIHSIEEFSGYVYLQANNVSKSIMMEVINEYTKKYPELEDELELFIDAIEMGIFFLEG